VVLADDNVHFGGSLNWEEATIDGQLGPQWARNVASELAGDPNFTSLTSTMVTAAYEHNLFTLVQSLSDAHGVRAECHWKLHARQVVLATGSIDRPLIFQNNDRPGIMLSSAVRRLIREFAVAPGRELALYTNNDSGYLTAFAAHAAGLKVVAIVDTRPARSACHAARARELELICHFESQIESTFGYRRLSSIRVCDSTGRGTRIACDSLAVTGGFTPLVHLASHRGVKPVFDEGRSAFLASNLPQHWHSAGGVAGTCSVEDTIEDGAVAAKRVAAKAEVTLPPRATPAIFARAWGLPTNLWRPNRGKASKMWVDFQNDVKVSDVELAAREGYVSVEHLKRYTTLGMGTDQGRTSNVNGLAIMANLTGKGIDTVGTTSFRPPYTAVRMETIASQGRGDLFKPRRRLPAHRIHQQFEATFEDFGWERPDWYGSNAAEREAAVAVEMSAVREQVGVFDSSSLGKIEIAGRDAGAFLARFYVSNMSTMKPGKIRYSVMLKEDGVIFDDGVVACLAPHHYLASPTSGNAEAIAAWFERWRQTEWPSLHVAVSPVTSNWASIAIAGPHARKLFARLDPNFDISNAAFAHMEIRQGRVAGVMARVARVSFTGELQYEITVQARYGSALLTALLEARDGLQPRMVGVEAWMRLRLEKGYLHLGSDTNGRTTPIDVGMGSIVSKRTDDFIGKRSLTLPFAASLDREQLVGVVSLEGILEVGARVLVAGSTKPPCPTDGYVTSACFSPSVGKSVGLALIERGRSRHGETVSSYSHGQIVRCEITPPIFYDRANERLQS
jgi:sarcosine oxidase subunit alpha